MRVSYGVMTLLWASRYGYSGVIGDGELSIALEVDDEESCRRSGGVDGSEEGDVCLA